MVTYCGVCMTVAGVCNGGMQLAIVCGCVAVPNPRGACVVLADDINCMMLAVVKCDADEKQWTWRYRWSESYQILFATLERLYSTAYSLQPGHLPFPTRCFRAISHVDFTLRGPARLRIGRHSTRGKA